MAKLRVMASNVTELELSNGNIVMFSYNPPVAAYIKGRGYVRSAQKYSVTTSKHVTKWLGHAGSVQQVEQSVIDALLEF